MRYRYGNECGTGNGPQGDISNHFEVKTVDNKIIVDGSTNTRHFPVNKKSNANISHSHSENLFQASDWPRLMFVRDSSRWGDIVIYFCWIHSQGLPNTAIRRTKIFHSLCRLRLQRSIHCRVIKTLSYCHKWVFKGGSSIASHLNSIFFFSIFFILSNATCYLLPSEFEAEILRLDYSYGSQRDKAAILTTLVAATTKSLF